MFRWAAPKQVVYTCLFGRYEALNEQPISAMSNWDFVCFTDRSDVKSETWQVLTIITQGLDASRESRRPKLLPHRFLADYDLSLYIDNSVILRQLPEEIVDNYGIGDADFCCFKHPWRDCTYDEAEEIIAGQIDDEARVREQMDFYEACGLPRRAGLVAGTFLLRKHNDAQVIAHGEDWYAHVLRFSKRDQLAFQFNARRHLLKYRALDLDLASNPIFSWPMHNQRVPYGFDANIYLWLNPDVARAGTEPTQHYVEHGRQENRALRYHTSFDLERLANRYRSDKGRLYYNRHFYSRIYEKYLSPLRTDTFTLLEIGLLRHDMQARNPEGPFSDAPSLNIWRDYFSKAEIHGFDIQDFTAVEGDRVKFTQGDQSKVKDLARAVARCSQSIKVIIDDGLHASPHQQISLGFLFQKLEPGGLYIIEDLHYQPPRFEPANALKTIDLLKGFAAGREVAGAFMSEAEISYFKDQVESIRFYDSMDYNASDLGADAIAVIRKRAL